MSGEDGEEGCVAKIPRIRSSCQLQGPLKLRRTASLRNHVHTNGRERSSCGRFRAAGADAPGRRPGPAATRGRVPGTRSGLGVVARAHYATLPMTPRSPLPRSSLEAESPAMCLPEWWEAQAVQSPEAIAVECESRAWTYRELDEAAMRIAARLQQAGVGPDTPVAFSIERSLEMLAGLLGILRAGGAYVPLDPIYPEERRRHMIRDSGAFIILGDEAHCAPLATANVRMIDVHRAIAEPAPQALTARPPDISRRLAYIIYTSGSTGQPKGVEVTHGSVANLLRSFIARIGLQAEDVVVAAGSMSFDISVAELFAPLLVGGRVVIVTRDVARDGRLLAETLDSRGATMFQATPSQWQLLVDAGWTGRPQLQAVCGGEALSRSLANELLARTRAVWNGYGPTETTVYSTLLRVTAGQGPVPVGDPIDNTLLRFVDEAGGEAAVGVVAELYIGGAGLARGYRGDAVKTAERFVPDRWSDGPGARLYRTGDLFRRAADGRHEFLGRADHQVKLRGFRIELGEIEAVLATHPSIKSAVVVTAGEGAAMHLVAALVLAEGRGAPTAEELRHLLGRTLPEYMIPARYLPLAVLPLTPNGKADRKAVAALAVATGATGTEVLLDDPLEASIGAIWSEVLHASGLGRKQDFFEAGGNSLLAGRVLARIRELHRVELSWSDFHRDATIAGLAAAVRAGTGREGRFPVPVASESLRTSYPLSSAQQRLWFVEQLEPGNRAYMFGCLLRFRGALDLPLLERALTEILERHAILRSAFVVRDGQPCQVPLPAEKVHLDVLDLSTLPPADRLPESRRLAAQDFGRPFDLAGGKPVRWWLHRLAQDDYVLLHHEHHLIHDGWSFRVFVGELVCLYAAHARGEPMPLPAVAVQFGDFSLAEERWLASPAAAGQLEFWRSTLQPTGRPLPLPYDRPRPPRQSLVGSSAQVDLPLELCRAVRGLCRREGWSLYPALLSAFQVLLQRLSGEDFVFTGCGMANRKARETEGVIGMFVNNVVLQADLGADPTFVSLVGENRARTIAAQDNADIPFDRVVTATGTTPDLSYNPLFQVMFNFHDSPLLAAPLPGLSLELTEAVSNGSAKFDLNIIVLPHSRELAELGSGRDPDSIQFIWEYSSDLFDRATVERFIGLYRHLLAAAVAAPDSPVSALPLVDPAAWRDQVERWNRTAVPIPRETGVHALFEERVAAAPDAVALTCDGRRVTYRELDARAEILRERIEKMGADNRPVAVLLNRSIEFVVAALAILKAGGAYVPLDPDLPVERMRFMLEDSGARLVVAEAAVPPSLLPPGVELLELRPGDAVAPGRLAARPRVGPAPGGDHPACVMYTSGSTGRPKGIVIPHRAIVRLVRGQDYASFDPGERFLLLASPAFDASTFELWGPLLNGGTCAIFPLRLPDLDELEAVVRREGVTCLWLTAGLFNQVVDQRPSLLGCVRHVLTGGEVLSVPHVQRALAAHPGLCLTNGYGPTESTTFACTHRIRRGEAFPGGAVPIGRPLANTRCLIVDRSGRLTPVGAPGELCLGGDGLALGYLNQPGLTDAKFVADTFSAETGGRLYRTGDLCRWLPEGTIAFCGRLDDQVKIRGFRIEPGEIESALAELPGVGQAAVVVREDKPGEKRLVAYVVGRDGSTVSPGGLREKLRSKLPEYMVPSAFLALDRLPLTPNGKVDRRALPAPERAAEAASGDETIPVSPIEPVIADIWRDVLHLEQIGREDNFFDLGGHSLLAMQVASRLRAALGVPVPLRTIFDAGTVARLAAALERLHEQRENEAEPPETRCLGREGGR